MQKTPGTVAKNPRGTAAKNPPQLAPLQNTPVTVWNVPTVAKNPYYRRKKPQPQCRTLEKRERELVQAHSNTRHF